MIKPEQVPDEACDALKDALLAAFSKTKETTYKSILADVLNAWPGGGVCHFTIGSDEGYEMILPLPFPQEVGDE